MNTKQKILGTLFAALVAILFVRPMSVYELYNNLFGRIFLLGVLVYLTMKNITFGLLVALIIIASLNQYGSFTLEGMENPQKKTTEVEVEGVDKEDIKNAIAPKSSNSLPAMKSDSSEVNASSPSLLTNTKIESFASYASAF
jgi:hypothetical protein